MANAGTLSSPATQSVAMRISLIKLMGVLWWCLRSAAFPCSSLFDGRIFSPRLHIYPNFCSQITCATSDPRTKTIASEAHIYCSRRDATKGLLFGLIALPIFGSARYGFCEGDDSNVAPVEGDCAGKTSIQNFIANILTMLITDCIGVKNGFLANCPDSPSCVSSQDDQE